jgi:TRAP-type transport system periplasmic protein
MSRTISRGRYVAGAAATLASVNIIRTPARAAQFEYKYGNQVTVSHPVTVRMVQMWKAVEEETGGRLAVKTFPNSVLGGDTQMIGQMRSGALQFMTTIGAILGTVVPVAAIDSVAFAFKDSTQAFQAMDGDLGAVVRKEMQVAGIIALPNAMDNDFRQITSNKVVANSTDLAGLKIRVPSAPILVDLFKTLGASPVPINAAELYTSLQTHLVDAQENAIANIAAYHLQDVQKNLNLSNHAWSCWWVLGNKPAWDALPSDIQAVVLRNLAKYSAMQRRDRILLREAVISQLAREGMTVTKCDRASFTSHLTPYYAKWKDTFGTQAWTTLEKYTGRLA